MHLIEYDNQQYDFAELLKSHFGVDDLSKLHETGPKYSFFDKKDHDQSTVFHKKFYEIYDKNDDFLDLYRKFLSGVVYSQYNEPIVYQKRPTFRIHMPGNVAVGEWHKDKQYNHQVKELNYWMPFTPAFGNNTIWIESEEDKGDYRPLECDYGQVWTFDGANLRHGNKPNDTDVSRVSMDFRVLRLSDHKETENQSSHLRLNFKIGEYYEVME